MSQFSERRQRSESQNREAKLNIAKKRFFEPFTRTTFIRFTARTSGIVLAEHAKLQRRITADLVELATSKRALEGRKNEAGRERRKSTRNGRRKARLGAVFKRRKARNCFKNSGCKFYSLGASNTGTATGNFLIDGYLLRFPIRDSRGASVNEKLFSLGR